MALIDANNKCLCVDVVCNDHVSDRGVFNGSTLQTSPDNCALYFPVPRPASGDERPLDCVLQEWKRNRRVALCCSARL